VADQPREPRPRSGTHDSIRSLLTNRNFGFYVGIRVTQMLGLSIQSAAIMWQVYDLTGSYLPLAMVGVARFVPSLAVSFYAGLVVDVHDRRLVLALSQLAPLGTGLVLAIMTIQGTINLTAIYACTALLGVAGAFEGPARQAILPHVVPPQDFQRGVAVATIVHQVAGVFGPAVAGVAIALWGVAPAYLMYFGLIAIGLLCIGTLRIGQTPSVGGIHLGMIKEGFVFIWTHPAILGAMALDMFAVILANADALLPVFARDILDVGAVGFGLLTSSKAVGSLLVAIVIALMPPIIGTGRAMIISVLLFGVATVGFGLSTWFPLSLVLYALIAGFDQISVVLRQSIINLGTPDEFRGRVGSVNHVFVGASNQLGGTRAGLMATWTDSASFAVVSGGFGCLIATGVVALLIPSLWRLRQDMLEESARASSAAGK
jgi:MFS family permease